MIDNGFMFLFYRIELKSISQTSYIIAFFQIKMSEDDFVCVSSRINVDMKSLDLFYLEQIALLVKGFFSNFFSLFFPRND